MRLHLARITCTKKHLYEAGGLQVPRRSEKRWQLGESGWSHCMVSHCHLHPEGPKMGGKYWRTDQIYGGLALTGDELSISMWVQSLTLAVTYTLMKSAQGRKPCCFAMGPFI